MIMEALRVLFFGMIGILIVMSIIILATLLLKRLGKREPEEYSDS